MSTNTKQEELFATLTFLGGNNADRIGGNSNVFSYKAKSGITTRVMTDLGALFTPYWSGFDQALPDFRPYFHKRNPDGTLTLAPTPVAAVVLTHFHEDHIGGVIHATRMGFELPDIYCSKLTKAFIRLSFKEAGIEPPTIHTIEPQKCINIGDNIEIEPFYMTHSATDTFGFHILAKEEDGQIVGLINYGDGYTSTNYEKGTNFDRDHYNDILKRKITTQALIDSTSISEEEEERPSFEEIKKSVIEEAKKHPKKRIISPVISRSTENIAIDIEAAKQLGRVVLLDGMWLKKVHEAMQLCGYTHFDKAIYKGSPKNYLEKIPKEKQYIICTGAFAQGLEAYKKNQAKNNSIAMSSFTKMALGLHPTIQLDKNTLVLARQRLIPEITGEYGIEMYSRASAFGAKVICSPSKDAKGKFEEKKNLQFTGHQLKSELKTLIKSNTTYIPIHSNKEQLQKTAKIISELGGSPFVATNIDILSISKNHTRVVEQKKSHNWIAVEMQMPDPLKPDPSIPPEGRFVYSLIDENYQKIEELAVIDNARTTQKSNKDSTYNNERKIEEAIKNYKEEYQKKSSIKAKNCQNKKALKGRER